MTRLFSAIRPRWIAAASIALASAAAAGAQTPADEAGEDRPGTIGLSDIVERVVHRFDFDEPLNPRPIPDYWVRIDDPNFPLWNPIAFDPPRPVSGETIDRVFELSTRGGNTGIRLAAGVVAAMPETDYAISAQVRTIDLGRARARLVARLLTVDGRPLPGSEVRSRPFHTSGRWEPAHVELRGDDPAAAWIQIDLVIEQLDAWVGEPRVGQEVRLEQVSGRAQFDDVVIWRLPRIEFAASDTNIVPGDRPVDLSLRVSDLILEPLRAELDVYDVHGRLVAEHDTTVRPGRAPIHWSPGIDRAGWYRGVVKLFENRKAIGQATVDFVRLSPEFPVASPQAHFGITTEDRNPEELPFIASMVRPLGSGVVLVPVWHPGLLPDDSKAHRTRVAAVVGELVEAGVRPALALPMLPDALADGVRRRPEDVLEALGDGSHTTWSYLEEFLVGFGQRVRRWQVGRHRDGIPADHDALPGLIDAARQRLALLVPDLELTLPWPLEVTPPDRLGSSGGPGESAAAARVRPSYRFAPEFPSEALRQIGSWLDPDAPPADLLLEPMDPERFGYAAAATDLALRAILAREAGVMDLTIRAPWVIEMGRDPRPRPSPLYPVWRTLSQVLADRRAVDRLNLMPDVRAIVFEGPDGAGAIALWHESPEVESVPLRLFLGESTVSEVDLFGNARPLPLIDGEHEPIATREPKFLTGIDVDLARLRAGFRLDPPFVEASDTIHHHDIVLRNTWPHAINGTLRLLEPAHWTVDERVRNFSIPAGQEFRVPIAFTFPYYELAGHKTLVAEIQFKGQPHMRLRVSTPIQLGHKGVMLTPSYRLQPSRDGGPDDVIVIHEIRNTSTEPVWIQSSTIAPGYPLQKADVANLGPGETAYRTFRYPGGSQTLAGQAVRVNLQEIDGPGRINLLLPIE